MSRHHCPRCGAPLDGGPVVYTCSTGHGTYAADLPTDFQPRRAA